jgi:hypothetical protein
VSATAHRLLALALAFLLAAPAPAAAPPPAAPLPAGPRARLGLPQRGPHVTCLALSPDGALVVTAGRGTGTAHLWDVRTGRARHSFRLPTRDVLCVAFAPDGRTLALGGGPAAGGASPVQLADVRTGKPLRSFAAHQGGVFALAFAPDGKALASAGGDPSAWLWDPATGRRLREYRGDNRHNRAVAFSGDGRLLATGGDAAELTLWEAASGELLRDCLGRRGDVRFAAFLPGGQKVVWVEQGAVVRVNEVATAAEAERYARPGAAYTAFALSPDGLALATGGTDGVVRLWDLTTTSEQLLELRGHEGTVSALAFAADGKTLASGGHDATVLVWDLAALPRARRELYWAHLAGDVPAHARRAARALRASPAQSVPFLRERLAGLARAAEGVERLLAELDDDSFAVRERASRELARRGTLVRASLERVLAGKPPLEVHRRVRRLLARLSPEVCEERAGLRAVRVLEEIGTPAAREALAALARGEADGLLRREARAALKRLGGHGR